MRRMVLFSIKLFLGFWLVIVTSVLFLLLSNAPNVPTNAPFASVSINAGGDSSIYLPNPIFTCVETEQEFQCQTEIQNHALDLVWNKGNDYEYDLSNCRAQYNGQSVGCQETGANYAPILAEMYEVTDLELNPQELQTVQQKYRGINTLMQLGEVRLFWIVTGLALAAGLGAAFSTWAYPGRFSKAFASLVSGVGMYNLVWRQLGSAPIIVLTFYGLPLGTWDWVIQGVAIAAGVGTAIATAFLVWRSLNHAIKALVGLISSVGMFRLYWLALYLVFGFGLNIPEASWRLFTIISIILPVAAVIWPWLHKNQPIKRFLILGSGFGATTIVMNFFILLLLGLGYAD